MSQVAQVESPTFSAGVVLNESMIVVKGAPILRYMMGWSLTDVKDYCKKKGWSCTVIK